jgi:hypothetical protein
MIILLNRRAWDVIELDLWTARLGSWFGTVKRSVRGRQGRWQMGTILIIVLVVLLLGGGGGYYGYSRYGGSGIGGALGLVLIILLVLWFFGGLHINR